MERLPGISCPTEITVIAGIDVGTTRTGFGYCVKALDRIETSQDWPDEGKLSCKNDSAVLLEDINGAIRLVKFGRTAKTAYSRLNDAQRRTQHLFEHFKMTLFTDAHGTPNPRRPMARARDGYQVETVVLMTELLRYVKGVVMNLINRGGVLQYRDQEIQWVLTVPAIWSDSAKQHMQTAAHRAGLVGSPLSENLTLALEPESAALCCREECLRLPGAFAPGTKYAVMDCGGGTVDITVHQSLDRGRAREIQAPSGGDWGAINIEKAFIAFLRDLFGNDSITRLERDFAADLLEALAVWEREMHSIKDDMPLDELINVNVESLVDSADKLAAAVASYNARHRSGCQIQSRRMRLRLPVRLIRQFIEPTLQKISNHMRTKVLSRNRDLSYVFLVGGFCECDLMMPYMERTLSGHLGTAKLVRPGRPGLAVVHGAVLFGLNPAVIIERVMRLTYGVEINYRRSNLGDLPEGARTDILEGVEYVNNYFDIFVRREERIPVDHIVTHTVYPTTKDQSAVICTVYCTGLANKKVTDHCHRLASVTLPSDTALEIGDRGIRISLFFGQTSIKATSTTIRTGETKSVNMDYPE